MPLLGTARIQRLREARVHYDHQHGMDCDGLSATYGGHESSLADSRKHG